MLQHDLSQDASIIAMDSKGDLIAPLKKLNSIRDRLVLIEPDVNRTLALNPFDIPNASHRHTIELLEYMISGLLGAELTDLQLALTRRVVPMMVRAIPNPTINDLRSVLLYGFRDYAGHVDKLEPHHRDFIEDKTAGFFSDTYKSTRNQVVWRIDYLTSNDIIRTMFECRKTRFDIGALMDQGKVIVIDNSSNALTQDGCEFFSRFFLYLVLGAAKQRADRPAHRKLPCYFYIDECHDVIKRDQNTARIIDQCRSQNIALILAHQRTKQIEESNVLDALQNCAIRFANSDAEARSLADGFRATDEFMRTMPTGSFAAFVRDVTVHKPGLMQVPNTNLNSLPQMTHAEQAQIRYSMYDRYGYQPDPKPTRPPATPSSVPTLPSKSAATPAASASPSHPPTPISNPTNHDDEPEGTWGA
jgi:hypothetical protein